MTNYIDTSLLAAYYCPELLSEEAERRIRALRPPVISWLVEVLHSALAKKVRQQELTDEGARQIQELFQSHCVQKYYRIASLQKEDFVRARQWMAVRTTALRTLDALHLAVANRLDMSVLTADTIMARAGGQLGIAVEHVQAPQNT